MCLSSGTCEHGHTCNTSIFASSQGGRGEGWLGWVWQKERGEVVGSSPCTACITLPTCFLSPSRNVQLIFLLMQAMRWVSSSSHTKLIAYTSVTVQQSSAWMLLLLWGCSAALLYGRSYKQSVTGCGGYPAGHAITAGGQCIRHVGRPSWHGNPFGAVQVTLHNLLAL